MATRGRRPAPSSSNTRRLRLWHRLRRVTRVRFVEHRKSQPTSSKRPLDGINQVGGSRRWVTSAPVGWDKTVGFHVVCAVTGAVIAAAGGGGLTGRAGLLGHRN